MVRDFHYMCTLQLSGTTACSVQYVHCTMNGLIMSKVLWGLPNCFHTVVLIVKLRQIIFKSNT